MTTPISRAAVLEILRTPAASDTFPDMIRRVEALEGCGVRVKALEWDDFEGLGAKASGFYQANYLIQKWSGECRFEVAMSYPGYQTGYDGPRWHPTLEAAKAAAQADYEARILAALEPVAQPETPIPGQFETMCLAIEDVITGRGFDVEIPEEVKAYLRNVLMVGGWRGERD